MLGNTPNESMNLVNSHQWVLKPLHEVLVENRVIQKSLTSEERENKDISCLMIWCSAKCTPTLHELFLQKKIKWIYS
jgi:hypothetical protein